MKWHRTLIIGLLLTTSLFMLGCVSVATTAVGTAVKGAKVGTKAAVSTVGTAAKATGSVINTKEKESEPDNP